MKEIFGILEKFQFELEPCAIKYVNIKPKGIRRLQNVMDFCEMLREAQSGSIFYADAENFSCIGPFILGMKEKDPVFTKGFVGPRLGIFKEERANRRIYQYLPMMPKDSVSYVLFSPLFSSPFEPDLIVFLLTVDQAEIMLRAKSFETGEMWVAKGTPVATCAWLFIYPYLSGDINFTVTGFGFGMKARKLFPEGRILFSIPWDKIRQIVESLREMEWIPESFVIGPEKHKNKVRRIIKAVQEELERGKTHEEESPSYECKG
ncbi:MAG: DUF169 domain-containing protein [Desulfobacterota bacterium]|nr:DUF169 domain-containing protein [Thermodesulfobacteriota bacterium]MDW8001300.1 DUF169 domain-containing protein [Deltaproteobacteria bacterium]